MNHSLKFNWVPWCSFLTNSPFSFCLLFLCRYSSIFRKQFRLYSRWQSSTLAKIPSGPHRDGRPQRCPVTDSPQRPLQHTDPSAQSQLESLPTSFKSFQLPLPTPRLPDSLQTPPAKPLQICYRVQHWTATKQRGSSEGQCLSTLFLPLGPLTAPFSSLTFWRIHFLVIFFSLPPDAMRSQRLYHLLFDCKSFSWSSIWVSDTVEWFWGGKAFLSRGKRKSKGSLNT